MQFSLKPIITFIAISFLFLVLNLFLNDFFQSIQVLPRHIYSFHIYSFIVNFSALLSLFILPAKNIGYWFLGISTQKMMFAFIFIYVYIQSYSSLVDTKNHVILHFILAYFGYLKLELFSLLVLMKRK